jgi:hypothetical protein
MRSFIWVLPVILLISVVIMSYLLGVAQDRAKKTIINQTGLSGLGYSPKATDTVNPDKKNSALNSTVGNNSR